jgi:transposase-like protein
MAVIWALESKRSFDRTVPCGDIDESADVDRSGGIGSHIWSTIYLTLRGRVAVLNSGLELAAVVAGEEQKGRIVAESWTPGAVVSEVARRYEISPQHLFAWRKAARAGVLALPSEEGPMFVPVATPGDCSAMAGKPRESRLIKIEIAGSLLGIDLCVSLETGGPCEDAGLGWHRAGAFVEAA